MKCRFKRGPLEIVSLLAVAVVCSLPHLVSAQTAQINWPRTVEAGSALSVPTTGSGAATLYIVGPGGAVRKEVRLGESVSFGPDELHGAGRYATFLAAGGSTQSGELAVEPSQKAGTLSFLAKPSRLPVNLPDAISGVVYVFDAFGNLILQQQRVEFELSDAASRTPSHTASAMTNNGVAWIKMNSALKAGAATFEVKAGGIHEARVLQQVAGDPCTLKMSAKRAGERVLLETDPVRDCSGNPVPDGTIVTFTEAYQGGEATVDVPLKRGIARTELPDQRNARISVAAGVVMGNEIHWGGGQ